MVRVNRTRAKLLNGEVTIGGGVNFYAPVVVELYGAMGFDWAWIDCEHGSSNDSETENMVRAAELYDLTPIVRVPNAEASTILRFLDRGAQGIVVPHISSKKEAEAVVEAARYFPLGQRSSSTGGRTNRLGGGLPPAEYYEVSNRETLVIAMAETPEAVQNIRQIAAVPGIDGVLVGSSDLTQAMGMAGAEEVDAAIEKVIDGVRAEGKVVGVAGAGMSIDNIDRYRYFAGRGVQLLFAGVQDFVRRSGLEFLQGLRQSAG